MSCISDVQKNWTFEILEIACHPKWSTINILRNANKELLLVAI